MTKKQQKYKNSLIKQVHTSKKYREFFANSREDYEDKLYEAFGVRSSKELNITQLVALVKYLEYELPELPVIKNRDKDITNRQKGAIKKLWELYAKDKREIALLRFVYKITKKRYISINVISKDDASKVILALKTTLKER